MKELKKLNKYLYKYRYKLLAGLLITVISRIFSLITPRLVGDSITSIEKYISNNSMIVEDLRETLLINITIIIGASLISGFFTFLMRQTIINVSRYIEFDVKNEIDLIESGILLLCIKPKDLNKFFVCCKSSKKLS